MDEPLENCPISFHNLGRILHAAVEVKTSNMESTAILDTSSSSADLLSTSILSELDSTFSVITF